uniref:Uncharacterized protein n=1 Tax=Brassica campestris TaxID=3711 RepID=A0A3P6BXA4_BRACM|nr:unnamed protein product [Brassica rapa]
MGEELADTMNLDLKLGPGPESSDLHHALYETVNFADWREVTSKTLTPIYGHGNHKREVAEECLDTKIPMRPHARRIESLRNTIQRSLFTIPMEEMIRRIQSRFDRDSTLVPEASERVHDRANSILNRFMTSRGVRSEHNQASAAAASSEDIDLNPNIAAPDLEG